MIKYEVVNMPIGQRVTEKRKYYNNIRDAYKAFYQDARSFSVTYPYEIILYLRKIDDKKNQSYFLTSVKIQNEQQKTYNILRQFLLKCHEIQDCLKTSGKSIDIYKIQQYYASKLF